MPAWSRQSRWQLICKMADIDIKPPRSGLQWIWEVAGLLMLFFVYAGDGPPMVNEAHYLVKAKNFWDPSWCSEDLFAASGKAHTTFYFLFGWPTQFVALETVAWVGRVVGWLMLAIGLSRLCRVIFNRPYASIPVAILWIVGIEYGNLAGEWVVGGIEAKVPAYGLILMGVADVVTRCWNRSWLWFGAASAFHVLSGGWAVVAAVFAWVVLERVRSDRRPLLSRGLFAGGVLSLFGLIPALSLTIGAPPEDSAMAAKIYSYFRIRHHLLPADFAWQWYVRHGALLAMTAVFWRLGRGGKHDRVRSLATFGLGSIGIAVCGMMVGTLPALVPDLAAKLLRFYWFRLSDAIVPLVFAVLVVHAWNVPSMVVRRAAMLVLAIAVCLFGFSSYDKMRIGVPPSVSNQLLGWDPDAAPSAQQATMRDWLAVCRWARLSTPSDEVFLTPRHQQTFKWYAGRAEVVNWKDVPQDASSLLQWRRRFFEVYPMRLGTIRVSINYQNLRTLRDRYGVRFMIVDRRVTGPNLPLVRLYPVESQANPTYAVYELPR